MARSCVLLHRLWWMVLLRRGLFDPRLLLLSFSIILPSPAKFFFALPLLLSEWSWRIVVPGGPRPVRDSSTNISASIRPFATNEIATLKSHPHSRGGRHRSSFATQKKNNLTLSIHPFCSRRHRICPCAALESHPFPRRSDWCLGQRPKIPIFHCYNLIRDGPIKNCE